MNFVHGAAHVGCCGCPVADRLLLHQRLRLQLFMHNIPVQEAKLGTTTDDNRQKTSPYTDN
jgi:hypothetical protein